MQKKFLFGLLLLTFAILFSIGYTFAADATSTMENAANAVRNVVGNAENGVEDAAKDISNTSKDVTEDMENGASDAMTDTNNRTDRMNTTTNNTGAGANTNTTSSQGNKPGRGAKLVGQVAQFYKNNTINVGMAMFGAAMGASQGSLSGIAGGATAGSMISRGTKDRVDAYRERKQVKRNEEIYEEAYERYKTAMLAKNPHLTDEDFRFNTKHLLNVEDISKIQDDDAREYATYAQGLRNTYSAIGIEDSDKAVLDELNYFQNISKRNK